MAKACGARTAAGTPCKRAPVEGKRRCKLHGGASTGPKQPNSAKNALKHGIYSRFLSADEKAMWDHIELGKVDDELRLCRIRLMRAMRAEAVAADQPELDEITDRGVGGATFAAREEKHKRRDYSAIIDRLTARVDSLEARRAALLESEQNRRIKEFELTERERAASGISAGVDFTVRRAGEELKNAPSD